jgi:DNA-binding MarR family transcriptional regulator
MKPSSPDPKKPGKTKPTAALTEKWGERILRAGWVLLPVALLEGQQELKLDPIDLALLLHLLRFWWEKGNLPHPSKERLARALGLQPRSVQRRLARLEKLHLVARHPRHDKSGRNLTSAYSFEGLIARGELIADSLVADRKARETESNT